MSTFTPSAALAASISVANPERVVWTDLIRVFATICVVFIHVSAVPATHLAQVGRPAWDYAVIYDAMSRSAVPLFMMTSGALLLGRPNLQISAFVWRRIEKVGIPLLFWTAMYCLWRVMIRKEALGLYDLWHYLVHGFTDPVYPHLWFLYVILILYALTPLIEWVLRKIPSRSLIGIILIWTLAQTIGFFLSRGASAFVQFNFSSIAGCVGYFIGGFALAISLPTKLRGSTVGLWLGVFIATAAIASAGTIANSSADGEQLDERLLAPLAPNILLMSCSAFILIRELSSHLAQSSGALISWLAATSFGVYLVHLMVIDVLDIVGLPLDPLPYNSIWYIPLLSGIVLSVSVGLVLLFRLKTWTRWIVP